MPGQRILLVDDEPDILESMKPLLEGVLGGVEVVTALSAAEGLDILRKGSVDLILSDYRMPAMNGLEFLQEAQRIVPGVPVMLITAYPDLEIALEAINKAGVESFITKPFRTEEVIDQVRAALFKRRVDRLWKDSLAQSLGRGGARP